MDGFHGQCRLRLIDDMLQAMCLKVLRKMFSISFIPTQYKLRVAVLFYHLEKLAQLSPQYHR